VCQHVVLRSRRRRARLLAACHGCRALPAMIVGCLHLPPRRSQVSWQLGPSSSRGNVFGEPGLSWEIEFRRRDVKMLAHRTDALHEAVNLRATRSA
jgi:hypothetical protein